MYNTDITLSYGKLDDVLDWCNKNCVDQWTFKVLDPAGSEPGNYNFIFEDKKDYVNFLLWEK
jgi:hypothetical protein